jgi:hypothetical protein
VIKVEIGKFLAISPMACFTAYQRCARLPYSSNFRRSGLQALSTIRRLEFLPEITRVPTNLKSETCCDWVRAHQNQQVQCWHTCKLSLVFLPNPPSTVQLPSQLATHLRSRTSLNLGNPSILQDGARSRIPTIYEQARSTPSSSQPPQPILNPSPQSTLTKLKSYQLSDSKCR